MTSNKCQECEYMVENIRRSLLDPKFLWGIASAIVVGGFITGAFAANMDGKIEQNKVEIKEIKVLLIEQNKGREENTKALVKNTTQSENMAKAIEKLEKWLASAIPIR